MRESAGGLHALAFTYLRDADEAEDVVQTAFLKAWQRWGEMEGNARRDAWMARTIRNECIDRWRRRQQARRYEAEAARRARGGLADSGGSDRGTAPLDETERSSRLDQAREIILGMAEPYRAVLILRFIDKLSYKEIARSLGQPLGTVKTHICRALKRVREELGERARSEAQEG